MTSREKLAADLDAVQRTSRTISRFVWAVAGAVMLYGIPIVYNLLIAHQAPKLAALLLSPAVDAALCVGLVATPVLALYNVPAGWIGALRWVAGLATWGLQTAGSWTHPGGPDWLGVFLHSVGPIILFAVVEGASHFQRRMGEVVATKRAELEAADRKVATERQEIANLRQKVHAITADRDAHRRQAEQLAATQSAATAEAEQELANARLNVEQLTNQVEALRMELNDRQADAAANLTALADRLNAEHNDAVRRLKDKHNEKLAQVRAEASTVRLSDYRNGGKKTTATVPTPKATLTDEDAVQAMLDAHNDPDYEWSQAEVRRVTGVGFVRAQKLIPAWLEAATLRGSTAGVTDGEATG